MSRSSPTGCIVGPEHRNELAGIGMPAEALVPVVEGSIGMYGHGDVLRPGRAGIGGEAQAGAGPGGGPVFVGFPVLIRLGQQAAGQGQDGRGAGRGRGVWRGRHRLSVAPRAATIGGGGVEHAHRQQPLGLWVDPR